MLHVLLVCLFKNSVLPTWAKSDSVKLLLNGHTDVCVHLSDCSNVLCSFVGAHRFLAFSDLIYQDVTHWHLFKVQT